MTHKEARRKPVGLREKRRKRKELINSAKFRKRKNNNHGGKIEMKQIDRGLLKCDYCKEFKKSEEITLDDSLIGKLICEDCLKMRRQVNKK